MPVGLRITDPVTYEVIVNGLASIPNEMSIRLVRSGTSSVFRDASEFCACLCGPDGTVVVSGLTLPVHAGSLPTAIPLALATVSEPWEPGDMLIFNDPEVGGLHLPDIFVMMPVFLDGVFLGFSTCTGHHVDTGGRVPGGNAASSQTIYEEGLRIPPVKLFRRGQMVHDVEWLLRKNVRLPDILIGDLLAQRAACEAGVHGLMELCRRYGGQVHAVMDEYVQYTADLFSERLRTIPDGRYEFEDYIEWEAGQAIRIRCALAMSGGHLDVDFAYSSPPVDFAINCPFSYTKSAVTAVLLSIIGHGVPLNGGLFRVFTVHDPGDSVVSWRLPRPCAARGVTMFRISDAVLGALAQALPDRVPAASEGGATVITIAGEHNGRHFNLFDALLGAWGGRQGLDGVTGLSNPVTNSQNTPVEIIEREYPVRVRCHEIAPGTGGDGEYRGGCSIHRSYELLAETATLAVRADRQVHPPWGLAGGRPGATGRSVIHRAGGRVEVMPSKFVTTLSRGDVFEVFTPGAGGYGLPERRSPARLAADQLSGLWPAR